MNLLEVVKGFVQPGQQPGQQPEQQPELGGGGKYTVKKLSAMTVDKLRVMAKKMGLNLYKTKDGKKVFVKKDTLVKKIAKAYTKK